MSLHHSKIKLEVILLKKGLHNFTTWKDSLKRYLQRKKAQHLVHRAYNKTITVHHPDKKRPIHHLLATVRRPAHAEDVEQFVQVDEQKPEANLVPDLPEVHTPAADGGLAANNRHEVHQEIAEDPLDEAERRFLCETQAYMDPRTGRAETDEQETLRYQVWEELAKSLYLVDQYVNGVQEGNIHTVLTRVCRAYKPATMTHLDTMEALAKLKKLPNTTISDLQGQIHALVQKRRDDTEQEVSEQDKKAAILKACKYDRNYSQFVRMLSISAKNESYDWVVSSLEEYETTDKTNNETRSYGYRPRNRFPRKSQRKEKAHQTAERNKRRHQHAPYRPRGGRSQRPG